MNTRLFITGGTIDGLEYDKVEDSPKNHHSLIPTLLTDLGLKENVISEELFAKDSKFITNRDRALIAKKSTECREEKIIISHGTMTMVETARYLGKLNIPKTIILFGALIPANKLNSDATANLSYALTNAQKLPDGVYIVMNDEVFKPDNVKKNLTTGRFELVNK